MVNNLKSHSCIFQVIFVQLFMYECFFILNISFSASTCISGGKQFRIPEEISLKCIKSAESIVNMSYSQAEVYTSVNIRHVLTTCPYNILHEM